MNDLLGLDDSHFTTDRLEFYGNISFMKAALISAHKVTTVSETYKNEIKYPFFGYRLDGLLQQLDYKLAGIVNGLDLDVYNPEVDDYIAKNYSLATIEDKLINKRELQNELGLESRDDVPIVGIITRLSEQKGLDLVKHVFHEMIGADVQFVLIGSGEPAYESFFAHMQEVYPDKVRAYIGFNEAYAHRVYAGSDLFLMPSLFEPCGLSQLISMSYGTIPLVRATGGLNDTVEPYNEFSRSGNGFSFENYNAHDLLFTYNYAINLYHFHKNHWSILMDNAMSADYSWDQSALKYKTIYEEII